MRNKVNSGHVIAQQMIYIATYNQMYVVQA